MDIYKLTSENLSNLGRMGDTPSINWVKYFSTSDKAEIYAEGDYGGRIFWARHNNGITSSGDLSHVMYTIKKIEIQD